MKNKELPNLIKPNDPLADKLVSVNINHTRIGDVYFYWKSPSFKGDKFFGWVRENESR